MRRVHVLPCGYGKCDKAAITHLKDSGKIVEVPVQSYLIEDVDANILVDTGTSVRWTDLHPEALIRNFPVYMDDDEHLDKMLRKLNFSTNDIDYVINTHLHYDHCGNNEMFPRARFLVNEKELSHAMAPGWWEALSYVRAVFDNARLKYELLRGDFEVLPGVVVIPTPGHSEGHQSVVIELEKTGPLILAGDAIYTRENLELPVLPGLYVDAKRYAESVDKLKSIIERRKGTILLSHWREYLSPQGWQPFKDGIQVFE